MVTMMSRCPHALLSLEGDTRQLPPFVDRELPAEHRKYAVGPFFEKISIEPLTIVDVKRCPWEITKLVSRLFYGNTLRLSRVNNEPNAFGRILGFQDSSSLHIFDLHGYAEQAIEVTSLMNEREAELPTALIRTLRRRDQNISVGCFTLYKTQTNLLARMLLGTPTYVNTIDRS